jgi:hypothetical protein
MEKYQKEGKYEVLDSEMPVVEEVAIIKVVPKDIRGKYKIGQHWARPYRLKMAKNIIEREGLEGARTILVKMGVSAAPDGTLEAKEDPVM